MNDFTRNIEKNSNMPTNYWAPAAAKSLQSCPTLCDPIDGSPPGSPIPGILQARTLEWVAVSFSNAWKWKVKVKSLSRVRLFATPGTSAYQAPPSMVFSRQNSGMGCHCLLHYIRHIDVNTFNWNYFYMCTVSTLRNKMRHLVKRTEKVGVLKTGLLLWNLI